MYLTFDPAHDLRETVIRRGVPTLEEMQRWVDGLIQPVDLFEDKDGRVTLFCNEEFLLRNDYQPSALLEHVLYHDELTIHGPFVIVRTDNAGETVSLKDTDCDRIKFANEFLIDFSAGKMVPILTID